MKTRLLGFLLTLTMITGLFSQVVLAAEPAEPAASQTAASQAATNQPAAEQAPVGEQPYVRTIMMYDIGSNLEEGGGMASYNLRQVLGANFSKDDRVKYIVMTGGSKAWHLESDYLYDPETGTQPGGIDPEYNQVWEAKGADAAENPGKLVLLEKEGLHGKKAMDEEDEDYVGEVMSKPQTLKDFINYCASNYPADKYDLILWDHGGGPLGGFGCDQNDGVDGQRTMRFDEILDAFSDNAVTKDGGKFDFINFDACLMGSAEMALAFSDYMDYYIVSPENVPEHGQDYSGWLNELGKEPEMDGFEVGKKILDDFIAFYDAPEGEESSTRGTMAVIDVNALMNKGFAETLDQLARVMIHQATEPDQDMGDYLYYDELDSYKNCIQYGKQDYYDLGTLAKQMSYDFKELAPADIIDDETVIDMNMYTETVDILSWILSNKDIIYARGTKSIHSAPLRYRDIYGRESFGEAGTSGLHIFFPNIVKSQELQSYVRQLDEVIEKLPPSSRTDKRREFLNHYKEALADYALIAKIGYGVSDMLDAGIDRSEINYDSFKNYMTSGDEYALSDWNRKIVPLLMIRAGYGFIYSDEDEQAAEDMAKDWLSGVIRQQALENVSRAETKLETAEEEGGTGYRVRMENTGKRVVENISYKLTAPLPAVKEFILENDYDEYGEDPDAVSETLIGSVSGELLYETAEGKPVSEGSKADYVAWYMEPSGTWGIPPMEQSWYAVKDADGYLHVANVQYDDKDMWFYGFYTSVNGIETMAALNFDLESGDLTSVLMGTEDGYSYREIPVDEFVGEIEVMPMRKEQLFLDEIFLPLSKKPVLLNKDTVRSIKIVRTDPEAMEDIRPDDADEDYIGVQRSVVIRDIYGFDIEYPLFHEGWNRYKGDWYYADETGTPVKGWLDYKGSRYYMDPETGARQTGWKRIDGKRYFFMDERCKGYTAAKEGTMVTGWKRISDKRYYFMDDRCKGYKAADKGVMATGWKLVSGKKFYFMDSRMKGYKAPYEGVVQTGWRLVSGKKYYFMDNRMKGYKAAYEGVVQTGFRQISSKKYYFMDSRMTGYKTAYEGVMQTGWKRISGKKYYFDEKGVLKAG